MVLNLDVSTKLWNTIEPHRKTLTPENYKLATGIAGLLTRIINQQDEVVLSVEYEHLLETMAMTDLPDIFARFDQIPKSKPELIAEANSILTPQLSAILRKVNQIKDEYSKKLVTAIRAQDDYINQKYAVTEPEEEGLKLTATQKQEYNPDFKNMFTEVSAKPVDKDAPENNGKRKLFGFF